MIAGYCSIVALDLVVAFQGSPCGTLASLSGNIFGAVVGDRKRVFGSPYGILT